MEWKTLSWDVFGIFGWTSRERPGRFLVQGWNRYVIKLVRYRRAIFSADMFVGSCYVGFFTFYIIPLARKLKDCVSNSSGFFPRWSRFLLNLWLFPLPINVYIGRVQCIKRWAPNVRRAQPSALGVERETSGGKPQSSCSTGLRNKGRRQCTVVRSCFPLRIKHY